MCNFLKYPFIFFCILLGKLSVHYSFQFIFKTNIAIYFVSPRTRRSCKCKPERATPQLENYSNKSLNPPEREREKERVGQMSRSKIFKSCKRERAVLVQELLLFLFRNSIFYYYLLFSFTVLPSKTYIFAIGASISPPFFRVLFHRYFAIITQ